MAFAEPNYLYHERHSGRPDFDLLWGLSKAGDHDIDAPEAWDTQTGSAEVVVAVIDSGVAYDHPELNDNIWANDDPAGGGDNDGNGKIDDTRGWDFIQNDNTPLDFNGHGTHVAGTIGAEGNNGADIAGVNWDVSIMPVRAATPSAACPGARSSTRSTTRGRRRRRGQRQLRRLEAESTAISNAIKSERLQGHALRLRRRKQRPCPQ